MTVKTIEINGTQDQFRDIIALAQRGIEVVLSQDDRPMAKLAPMIEAKSVQRIAGLHKGSVKISPDLDAPLDEAFWLSEVMKYLFDTHTVL